MLFDIELKAENTSENQMKIFMFSLGRVFDRSGAGFWGRLQVFPADVGDWFQRFCFYEKRRQLSFFTMFL